ALIYLAEVPSQQPGLPGIRIPGGAAIALEVQPDRLVLRDRERREADPQRPEPSPLPAPRVDLAAGLPADAALWVRVSCPPELLWSELSKTAPDPRRVVQAFLAMFGAEADR